MIQTVNAHELLDVGVGDDIVMVMVIVVRWKLVLMLVLVLLLGVDGESPGEPFPGGENAASSPALVPGERKV